MGMVINSFSVAPGSPYGSFDTWELQIDANNGGATRTTLSSFVFKDITGTIIPTTGGTSYSAGSGSDEAAADNSKAFDSDDTTTWSRSSTTNTRIGYQFATAVAVATIELTCGSSGTVAPKTCRLRKGTGGSGATFSTAFEIWEPSWTDAQTLRVWPQDTTGKWKQIRFRISDGGGNRFIAVNELEFRATIGGSDQTASGKASSDQTGVNEANAFDNNNSTLAFIDNLASPYPAYIAYSFATPVALAQIQLHSNSDNTRIPKDFKVQGTNDGSTITDLIVVTGNTGVIPFTQTYT